MEKNCVLNQSVKHSQSLFDVPRTEALMLWKNLDLQTVLFIHFCLQYH